MADYIDTEGSADTLDLWVVVATKAGSTDWCQVYRSEDAADAMAQQLRRNAWFQSVRVVEC